MQHTYFSTADLNLAASIIATANAHVVRIDRSEPAKVCFVFVADQVLDVVDAYLDGTIRVDPTLFSAAVRTLRVRRGDHIASEGLPTGLGFGRSQRDSSGAFRIFQSDDENACEEDL